MSFIPNLRSVGLALLVASSALMAGCGSHSHGPGAADGRRDSIVVVGVGKVSGKPDVARIHIGVESRSTVVADASQQNADQMTRLIAALKGAGVADKDIRTSNYSIYYERFSEGAPPMPVSMPVEAPAAAAAPAANKKGAAKTATAAPASAPQPPRAAPAGAYRVSNTVQITVRDLSKVGQILDTAVSTGANNVQGIGFELENDKAMEGKLREGAIADARERAAAIAKLSQIELGEVISVSEVIGSGGRGGPMPMAAGMDYAKNASPVESGEIQFEGRIEVVYSIKR